jgi:hypothetical protein
MLNNTRTYIVIIPIDEKIINPGTACDMLLAAGFTPTLLSLTALKSRALRRGVWARVSPAARALVDAAILYLRRGGRIKSPALVEALRKAAEEILRLAFLRASTRAGDLILPPRLR